MALLDRVARWAGARSSRRLSRSLPLVGTAVALAVAASAIRRKGFARGVADTGLNALPLVGGLKMVIETFTGDWFRDRPRPPATPALSGLGEEVRAAHSLRPSSRKRHS